MEDENIGELQVAVRDLCKCVFSLLLFTFPLHLHEVQTRDAKDRLLYEVQALHNVIWA